MILPVVDYGSGVRGNGTYPKTKLLKNKQPWYSLDNIG